MPLVRVEVRAGLSAPEKRALLDAVHAALVEALKIPDDDRTQRLYELVPEDFEIPSSKSRDLTLVGITMFLGRSREAKRNLFQALVRYLGALGISGDDLLVVLHEPPMENWGIRGGMPADEVDLEYRLDV